MPVVEVSSEPLLTAVTAAKKLLVTTVRFCRAVPFAAGGPCDETEIAGDCLSHWGSDCGALNKALDADGVAEALSKANPIPVELGGVKKLSYHAALLASAWNRLRTVQLICGVPADVPCNIDPAGVMAGHYRTMAGAMTLLAEINFDDARLNLIKEYQRASDRVGLGNKFPVFFGQGRYQLSSGEFIALNGNQASVLEALVDLRACTFPDLQKRSGVENPTAVVEKPPLDLPPGKWERERSGVVRSDPSRWLGRGLSNSDYVLLSRDWKRLEAAGLIERHCLGFEHIAHTHVSLTDAGLELVKQLSAKAIDA